MQVLRYDRGTKVRHRTSLEEHDDNVSISEIYYDQGVKAPKVPSFPQLLLAKSSTCQSKSMQTIPGNLVDATPHLKNVGRKGVPVSEPLSESVTKHGLMSKVSRASL